MGAYLFFGQILAWLPPLVFTALNEAGISIRINMLSLLVFWFISVSCLQAMGPYESAVSDANKDAEKPSSAVCNNPNLAEERASKNMPEGEQMCSDEGL